MIQQIALARLLGKLLALPASPSAGPESAREAGFHVLARPEFAGLWAMAERLAPNGTLNDVLTNVVSAYKTPEGKRELLETALSVKDLVIGALPQSFRGPVDFIVTGHGSDPEGLQAYIAESFNPRGVIDHVVGAIAVSKPYRCPNCDMPFFSSLPSTDITCPYCES